MMLVDACCNLLGTHAAQLCASSICAPVPCNEGMRFLLWVQKQILLHCAGQARAHSSDHHAGCAQQRWQRWSEHLRGA
jgi:hypothetical protein